MTYNGDGLLTNTVTATPCVGAISAVGALQTNSEAGVSTLPVSPQHVGDTLVLAVKIGPSGSR